jgi:non-ribosomal peptide synthase protein (TIGR01720 family)
MEERIASMKDQLREAYIADPRYGILRDHFKAFSPNKSIARFNFMGELDSMTDHRYFTLHANDPAKDVSTANALDCMLEFNCYVLNKKLHAFISYAASAIDAAAAEAFANSFMRQLNGVLSCLATKETTSFTPADFNLQGEITQSELDSLFYD